MHTLGSIGTKCNIFKTLILSCVSISSKLNINMIGYWDGARGRPKLFCGYKLCCYNQSDNPLIFLHGYDMSSMADDHEPCILELVQAFKNLCLFDSIVPVRDALLHIYGGPDAKNKSDTDAMCAEDEVVKMRDVSVEYIEERDA